MIHLERPWIWTSENGRQIHVGYMVHVTSGKLLVYAFGWPNVPENKGNVDVRAIPYFFVRAFFWYWVKHPYRRFIRSLKMPFKKLRKKKPVKSPKDNKS